MPYTAEQLTKVFSAMEKDEPIFIAYLTKEDVAERLEGYEFEIEDENEELIEPSTFVTNGFAEKVFSRIGDDDYLWERFNETFTDVVYDLANEIKQQVKEDKELWDTEMEKTNAGA